MERINRRDLLMIDAFLAFSVFIFRALTSRDGF